MVLSARGSRTTRACVRALMGLVVKDERLRPRSTEKMAGSEERAFFFRKIRPELVNYSAPL